MESECPKCGAKPWRPSKSAASWGWECGSIQHPSVEFSESCSCLKRQNAALTAEVERLRALLAKAEGAK